MPASTPFNMVRNKDTDGVNAVSIAPCAAGSVSVCIVGCGHGSTVPTSPDGFTQVGSGALASGQNISAWTRPNDGGEDTAVFETPTALNIVVHHFEVTGILAGPSALEKELVAPGASGVVSRTMSNSDPTPFSQSDLIAIGAVFKNGNVSNQAVTNGFSLGLYGASTATENMTSYYKVISSNNYQAANTQLSWTTSRYANGLTVVLKAGTIAPPGMQVWVKQGGVLVQGTLKVKHGGVLV